jgi:transposase
MKKLQIVRDSPNREELLELYKKEKNPRLKERYHALYLMHEFKNCTKVAEIIGRHRSTIINLVKEFNEKGTEDLVPELPPGRPSRLSKAQRDVLRQDLLTHPRDLGYDFSNWEGKSVAYHIKQKFDVEFKIRRVQYLLHELGFSLQRPRYRFPKADPKKQQEFAEELKKNWILLEKTM